MPAHLSDRGEFRLIWATGDPVSKNQNQGKQRKGCGEEERAEQSRAERHLPHMDQDPARIRDPCVSYLLIWKT